MITVRLRVITRIHGDDSLKAAAFEARTGSLANHLVWPLSKVIYGPLKTLEVDVDLPDVPTVLDAWQAANTAIKAVAGFSDWFLDSTNVIGAYHAWNGHRWVSGSPSSFQYAFALGFELLGEKTRYHVALPVGASGFPTLDMDFVILVAP